MNTYEPEIRSALANDFFQRAYEVCTENAFEIANRAGAIVRGTLDELVDSGEMSAPLAQEVEQLIPTILSQANAYSEAQRVASHWMKSREHYEKGLGNQIRSAEEGEDVEIPEALWSFYQIQVDDAQRKDNIVASLVDLAERKGFKEAIKTKNLRAAVRAEYKTAEDYREAEREVMESAWGYVDFCQGLKGMGFPLKLFTSDAMKKISDLHFETIVKADEKAIFKRKKILGVL